MRDKLSARAKYLRLSDHSIRFALRTMFYGVLLQTIVLGQAANPAILLPPQSHYRPAPVWAADPSRQGIIISWVGLSPDGRFFARAEGTEIRVWEVETGRLLKTFKGIANENYYSSWSVAFSPDSRLLASGSNGNPIRVWDLKSGNELSTFKGKPEPVSSIAFSPDGKVLATGGADKTIRLWNVASGKLFKTFAENAGVIRSLAFSPDGKLLACISGNRIVSLWDVKSERQVKSFEVRYAAFADFLANGKVLALYNGGRTLIFRGVSDEKDAEFLNSIAGSIERMSFSPDGKMMAAAKHGEKIIRLWDVETGRELGSFEPEKYNGIGSVIFSTDSKMLAVNSNKIINLWDLKSGKLLKSVNSQYANLSRLFSGGKLIGFWEQNLYRWDLKSGREFKAILK